MNKAAISLTTGMEDTEKVTLALLTAIAAAEGGRATLMFPGGPGFAAAYMRGDAELFSDTLESFLIDPPNPPGEGPGTGITLDRLK